MKAKVLNEGFDHTGRPLIAMWSNPITIYRRKDGSYYFKDRGKRVTVKKMQGYANAFYLATYPPA